MDKKESGIWQFHNLLPRLSKKYQLTLGEGNTPFKRIGPYLFKCEFENPTGSVKDRGMAYQISALLKKGIKNTVISSSGNAAISAVKYCQLANIKLIVFVSPKINAQKMRVLQRLDCRITKTPRPISSAFRYAKENQAYNLRPSKDPNATIGLRTLAFELHRQNPHIDAIFVPASSGTTLVGMGEGFRQLGRLPAIHAVQTEAVHPISSLFDKNFTSHKDSLVDAIVAKYTPRYNQIIKIIKNSHGWGWVVSDEMVKKAWKWLKDRGIVCSYEGGAALAALWKAENKGYKYEYPVCILTGKYY